MTDAMKAVGQDVQLEAVNGLVRIERHDIVTGSSVAPVIFPFEAHVFHRRRRGELAIATR